MKICIKNMVCDRCILVISNILDELCLKPLSISLGEVDFGKNTLEEQDVTRIRERIEPLGFELIDSKKRKLVERIKTVLVKKVHREEETETGKISDYIQKKLHYDYTYLSNLFSTIEGITIEQYYIKQKVEKIKELIMYDELSLTEISYRLGYSSLAHLSAQFKKVTGVSPSHFKREKNIKERRALDKL